MFDSTPVKALNFAATVVTLIAAIGGGFAGLELKGDDWGRPLAVTSFAVVAGFIVYVVFSLATVAIGKFRRTCPVCNGRGVVQTGYDEIMRPIASVCPKCKGDGLIF